MATIRHRNKNKVLSFIKYHCLNNPLAGDFDECEFLSEDNIKYEYDFLINFEKLHSFLIDPKKLRKVTISIEIFWATTMH